MKYLILMMFLVFSISMIVAQEQDTEKADKPRTYSEEEFKAAVMEEVSKRIDRVQVKNLGKFSKELLEKEQMLIQKERAVDKRISQLEINEKTLVKKIKDFQAKQNKLIGCIDEHEKSIKKRVDHMVKVISGMKPVKAAEILSVQDSKISVQILGLIDPVKASKIFNLMDKEISARLQKQYMHMKQ